MGRLALIKRGIPYRDALDLEPDEAFRFDRSWQLTFQVGFGLLEGRRYDWNTGRWQNARAFTEEGRRTTPVRLPSASSLPRAGLPPSGLFSVFSAGQPLFFAGTPGGGGMRAQRTDPMRNDPTAPVLDPATACLPGSAGLSPEIRAIAAPSCGNPASFYDTPPEAWKRSAATCCRPCSRTRARRTKTTSCDAEA